MTRLLTAAAAVAATLSIAGLAQAQTSPAARPNSPTPGAESAMPATGGGQTATGGAQTSQATPTRASRVAIREAQQKLKSQGLYHGAIDGQMGPATHAAVSRYQRKEGLPQTAMLDAQTLKHLLPGSARTTY